MTWGDPNEAIDPDERDDMYPCHRHPGHYVYADGQCYACEEE